MQALKQLIEISRFYGEDPAYVIAGGGNTSFKDEERIWIKASGIPLAGIGEEGFVCLSRKGLGRVESATYNDDPAIREEEVKRDMHEAIISPGNLRPSVETSLHNLIGYPFVVHTHPTLVNGLMCSNDAREEVSHRFGDGALYVEYTDPGYILFRKMQERISGYADRHGSSPRIIFLQNHGVFVAGDTPGEIRELYRTIDRKISQGKDLSLPSSDPVTFESGITRTLGDHFGKRGVLTRAVRSQLIDHFTENIDRFLKVSRPFSPDIIVYCKSNYLFLGKDLEGSLAVDACMQFEEDHGYFPKVILEEGGGLIAAEENERSLETVIAVYADLMKISYYSESFGGPHFMTQDQIAFIDNWEVEHYRRKVARERKP